MKLGTFLKILKDVIQELENRGVITADGDLYDAPGVLDDVQLGVAVEAVLKKHGVTVQADIDRVLAALPGILGLLGVK